VGELTTSTRFTAAAAGGDAASTRASAVGRRASVPRLRLAAAAAGGGRDKRHSTLFPRYKRCLPYRCLPRLATMAVFAVA